MDVESFIAVYDETEATATVEVVENSKNMASDNLEDKVTKEKDEEDDSLTVVSEPRSVELAENERQDTLVLLNANVTLN